MINKLTRHLGQKYRDDHRPRTRPHSLQTCSTSPRMVILSIPRLDVLRCSSPFTRDIGPGLSPYTAGTQGKIGPHMCIIKMMYLSDKKEKKKRKEKNLISLLMPLLSCINYNTSYQQNNCDKYFISLNMLVLE